MTLRERAEDFWASTANPDLRYEDIIPMVERVLQTAIEEEREACAKIVEDGGKSEYEVLTDHKFKRGGYGGLCTCGLPKEGHPGYHGMTRKQIIKAIRERSNS